MSDPIAGWARQTPDRIAFQDLHSRATTTYAALDARAAHLATALAARGVGPGDRVALLAETRVEVFEALFACLHLGATLVPLSWRLAARELAELLADCTPRLLLHDDANVELARELLAVPRLALSSAVAERRAAPQPILDDQLALILYTSGTTGRPKGVQITWRQVAVNARETIKALTLTARDRCLAFLPTFHTGGLNVLALPVLFAGGRVVLSRTFDAQAAVAALAAGGITATIAVPAMYQALWDAGLGAAGAPALRSLLCGGAPLSDALHRRYLDAGLPLRQGYGLTEVGPNCFSMSPADGPDAIGTIGAALPHTQARLVGDDGRDADVDEPGELWLRGPHVTTGYWRNPEATEAALTPDGWFRTGDLLARNARGNFRVVGRAKDMFISGGENVYPAEVERALAADPEVAEVCVVGIPDARWGEVGHATLVLRTPQVAEDALASRLRDRLARYKVPRAWAFVPTLPRTDSGKIDRAAVRAAALGR